MSKANEKEQEVSTTVLGKETVFIGDLEFTDNLCIQGKFEGTIDAKGSLTIDKTADCKVDHISASAITIEGKVLGNINAADRLEMKTGSEVRGNVKTSKLRIADGVLFDGQVEMIRPNVDFDIFTSKGTGIKDTIRLSNK